MVDAPYLLELEQGAVTREEVNVARTTESLGGIGRHGHLRWAGVRRVRNLAIQTEPRYWFGGRWTGGFDHSAPVPGGAGQEIEGISGYLIP